MSANDHVRYHRDPDLPALETCLFWRSPHVFPKHWHETIYAVGLMEEGGCWGLGPDREDLVVTPGRICLINPGQMHSGIPLKDQATYHMLYLDAAWLREAALDLHEKDPGFPEFSRMVVHDPAALRMLHRLVQTQCSPGDPLEKESAMTEAFACLLAGYGGVRPAVSSPGRERRAVAHAAELLANNLADKVSLTQVAQSVGLSRCHLLRVFKSETGLPPHAFRTQRRIEAAKSLLRQNAPISETAQATGFTDQSHFTHTFKLHTGLTPARFLER